MKHGESFMQRCRSWANVSGTAPDIAFEMYELFKHKCNPYVEVWVDTTKLSSCPRLDEDGWAWIIHSLLSAFKFRTPHGNIEPIPILNATQLRISGVLSRNQLDESDFQLIILQTLKVNQLLSVKFITKLLSTVMLLSLLRRCWLWPNLFTVWHSVGAEGLIATLGSKDWTNQTLFASQYKKSHKRNTYDR